MRRFLDAQKALPLGCGVAAMYGAGPVELGIAARDEVSMEVGDIAIGIGEDGVVRRVGLKLHGLPVRLIIAGLGARVGLREGFDRLLHQADRHPLPPDSRTMRPWCVRKTVNFFSAIRAGVLYGTVISAEVTGRSSEPYL